MIDTSAKKSVILITVDSLRADFLNLYQGPCPCPSLEKLASNSIVYKRAFSTGGHTKQSFPGILGSSYPTSGGVEHFGNRFSIAEAFKQAGYITAGFHSNPLLAASKGYGAGFDLFWDSLNPESQTGHHASFLHKLIALGAKTAWKISPKLYSNLQSFYHKTYRKTMAVDFPYEIGRMTNQRVFDWLQTVDQPFFLWVHYMDVHHPWAVSEDLCNDQDRPLRWKLAQKATRYPETLTKADVDELKQLYSLEIEYMDRCLSSFFETLKKSGLWDNTTLAFTSDHGEGFMEHDIFFHGNSLYNELLHVPLLIKHPDWQPECINQPVSLIDLAPTLLTLANVDIPSQFEGTSLTPNPEKDYVVCENAYRNFKSKTPELIAILKNNHKLIVNFSTDQQKLFDLESDPHEKHDISGDHIDIVNTLRSLIEKHLERIQPEINTTNQTKMASQEDEQIKQRLIDLGYMDE